MREIEDPESISYQRVLTGVVNPETILLAISETVKTVAKTLRDRREGTKDLSLILSCEGDEQRIIRCPLESATQLDSRISSAVIEQFFNAWDGEPIRGFQVVAHPMRVTELAPNREPLYSVRRNDVHSTSFVVPFPIACERIAVEPLRMKIELRALGMEISDTPMVAKVYRTKDTGVLSFLVLSRNTGTQTLKIRILCDDDELISNLLRTKFVYHGGPGGGPAGGMRTETDGEGRRVLVLAETELFITFSEKNKEFRTAGATTDL